MSCFADRNGIHLHRLTLTPDFLFLLSLSWAMDIGMVLRLSLLAALLHEGGHLLACLLLGVPVQRLRLTCCGGVLETWGMLEGRTGLLIALAGPAVNLLTAFALLPLANAEWAAILLGVSLVLGLFNLLPVLPLDGGRAAYALLLCLLGEEIAEKVLLRLSTALKTVLITMGAVLCLLGNPSLLLVAIIICIK